MIYYFRFKIITSTNFIVTSTIIFVESTILIVVLTVLIVVLTVQIVEKITLIITSLIPIADSMKYYSLHKRSMFRYIYIFDFSSTYSIIFVIWSLPYKYFLSNILCLLCEYCNHVPINMVTF